MTPWYSFLCLTVLVFLLIDLLIGHSEDLLISVHLNCSDWVLTFVLCMRFLSLMCLKGRFMPCAC